jgi:tRNA G26 N,N-dimethylase Trm1
MIDKNCKHCGEAHYSWNCPIHDEKIVSKVNKTLQERINPHFYPTVKKILVHLQTIKIERTTAEIANRVGVSSNTARKWLWRLHKAGHIKCRAKFYGRGISLILWSSEHE